VLSRLVLSCTVTHGFGSYLLLNGLESDSSSRIAGTERFFGKIGLHADCSLFPNKNGWGRPEERAKEYGVYSVTRMVFNAIYELFSLFVRLAK
jgi:hypothetical protein